MSPFLILEGLKKSYNKDSTKDESRINVIEDFSQEIKEGEVIAFFGPNGCGKTTLLNIVSGVEKKYSGKIKFNKSFIPHRDLGYFFQNYEDSLFPWSNVKENICLKYRIDKLEEKEIQKKISDFAALIGISLPWDSYPYQLSGGQKQITALMRTLIYNPSLCILDEPLSALDFQNSLIMLESISKLWTLNNTTALFVSHDIEQAIFLADKLIILTKLPLTIKETIAIPFPKPRNISLLDDPKFIEIRNLALKLFREEISI